MSEMFLLRDDHLNIDIGCVLLEGLYSWMGLYCWRCSGVCVFFVCIRLRNLFKKNTKNTKKIQNIK